MISTRHFLHNCIVDPLSFIIYSFFYSLVMLLVSVSLCVVDCTLWTFQLLILAHTSLSKECLYSFLLHSVGRMCYNRVARDQTLAP